jgi:hypothetical protein
VSTVLDRIAALRAGDTVDAECPRCRESQVWWGPNSETAQSVPAEDVPRGLKCYSGECGCIVELYADPPAILCSSCGDALERAGNGYRCGPCRREVRP